MSRGLGKRQIEILQQLADGQWHLAEKLTCPEAVYIAWEYAGHGASRPLVLPGTGMVYVSSSGKHKSTLRALRALQLRGLVQMRRRILNGTGNPIEARIIIKNDSSIDGLH